MKTARLLCAIAIFLVLGTSSCSKTENSEQLAQETTPDSTQQDSTQSTPSGESLYQSNCAACHDAAMYKAPSRLFVSLMGPVNILNAMNGGLMTEQASAIDTRGRIAIAEYISGQSLDSIKESPQPPACDDKHGFDAALTPVSAGWGGT